MTFFRMFVFFPFQTPSWRPPIPSFGGVARRIPSPPLAIIVPLCSQSLLCPLATRNVSLCLQVSGVLHLEKFVVVSSWRGAQCELPLTSSAQVFSPSASRPQPPPTRPIFFSLLIRAQAETGPFPHFFNCFACEGCLFLGSLCSWAVEVLLPPVFFIRPRR